ncbi:MAG: SDR family oxidoreductase [Shimia sp.]
MSILLFGATGQIGREIAAHPGVIAVTREQADLRDPTRAAEVMERGDISAVINATGLQDAIAAERQAGLAYLLNARAPRALGLAAARRGVPFVTFSGPSVFGGGGERAFAPGDVQAPKGVLGRSKASGETSVMESGGPFGIIRTSWVFAPGTSGFLGHLLGLGRTKASIPVVDDDVAAPTPAAAVAAFAVDLARRLVADPGLSGAYHFTGQGAVSRADLAREVMRLAGMDCRIEGRPGADLPLPLASLGNGRLATDVTETTLGVVMPDWRGALATLVTGGAAQTADVVPVSAGA